LARDLYQKLVNPEARDDSILSLSKITTAAVTLAGLVLAYFRPKMILDLAMIAWACLSAAIMAPFVYSLYWRKATRTAATFTSVSSFLLAVVWGPWFLNRPFNIHEFLISQVFAWAAFPVVNYIATKKGSGTIPSDLIEGLWNSIQA
ncbi:MAG: hypothetical protein OEW93_08565, partial [Candidatus Bathyarchaeota archaeon]|nr:hypothetical protein [Candidatus Bathyarchaeota archaeon]